MTNTLMKILILSLLVLNISQTFVIACYGNRRGYRHTTIVIVNKLPTNADLLEYRCQSKNHDFGLRNLWMNQSYDWSFCPSVFGRTLYFCHFYWGSKHKAFDVFTSKLARNTGSKDFYWIAKSDGIYLDYHSTPTRALKKIHDWE
ncbi:hypothetical protein CASFOL_035096 [Castilleja foliolosa]|uniref:S-protein homolog n=1 Tax=Castilleja foliolosa TaxID=1961234 RepID=A0ABD3BSW7_9LAMI